MSKLYVVGIGPGGYDQMTIRAASVLEKCDVIVGYTVYVELIEAHFPGKTFLTTPMRQEEKRCRMAFEEALKEKERRVAMICSGDAGIYGMSGLIYELSGEYPHVDIEIVGGVTAAISGAALLGAPLMHDFAVISLSDLLTPWDLIEGRLEAAAASDMVICLYNPSSKKRRDYLHRACEIILRHGSPDRVCGVVRSIGRKGESCQVMTLGELKEYEADMFTTVFIGSSATKNINGKMVTPRGYRL